MDKRDTRIAIAVVPEAGAAGAAEAVAAPIIPLVLPPPSKDAMRKRLAE